MSEDKTPKGLSAQGKDPLLARPAEEKREKSQSGPRYIPKKPVANCESCIHFVFDEEYGDYACETDLDEDETVSYVSGGFRECPYYRYKDEYLSVRKQI
ncbi:MAG: DUF6472 family protein [Clostridia bacterium]|nr:DUF6472 family protein [Clostridia bacterium]